MHRLLRFLAVALLLGVSAHAADRCDAYTAQGARAESVPLGIVADVNGDGIPDIVSSQSVYFGMTAEVKTGLISAVARRSRKGPFDLLRISKSSSSVWSLDALRVTPDGVITIRSTPLPGSTAILTVGDFNGDGIDDVVLRDQIRFGTPDGTFTAGPPLPLVIPYDYLTVDIAVGDFDGDHNIDLAIRPDWVTGGPPWVNAGLTIYSGDGKGNFHASRTMADPEKGLAYLPMLVADVDGDGLDDLIFSTYLGIDILPSRSGATMQHISGSTSGLVTGDFNGDGRPDLAAIMSDSTAQSLHVWLNDGTGRMQLAWQTKIRWQQDLTGGSISSKIFARDVDGDGKDDLVVAPSFFLISMGAVLHSRGDGSFTGLPAIASPYSYWGAAGDLDGDGDDDVVLASYDNVQPPRLPHRGVLE